MIGKRANKFWNILKAISNLFDFTVRISFVDGKVVDFSIDKSEVIALEEEAG